MNVLNEVQCGRGALVLVAEEDDELRDELCSGLRGAGYRVVDVEDGLELLDYLELTELFPGRLERPKLIVSDVKLKGCSGIEACRLVGYQRPAPPFLLLAPDADAAVRRDAINAGVLAVVGKRGAREVIDAVDYFIN